MIKCGICGKEFKPTIGFRGFCSLECRKENHRRYMRSYRKWYYKENPQRRYIGSAKFWKDLIYDELGRVCVRCGDTENLELDHKIPLALGGEHRLLNIQVLCHDCHYTKTTKFPARRNAPEWLEHIKKFNEERVNFKQEN